MPRKKKEEEVVSAPALTPESRENQLIHLATKLAEKQLRDGSASPSVIQHYLKLGTKREQIEREILEKQAKLIEAKAAHISKDGEAERIAKAAMDALKSYRSNSDEEILQ